MDTNISSESLLSSYKVADLLQVNPSSVNKWVRDGRIPAFRTPGGHRRILASDLVAFLASHNMPIPECLAGASKRRILAVTPNLHDRQQLINAFARAPNQADVQYVDNGVDALLQIGVFKPHIIVLDMSIADIDGLELLRRLQDNNETKHTHIVALTSNADRQTKQQCHDAGVGTCLEKPVSPDNVIAALSLET